MVQHANNKVSNETKSKWSWRRRIRQKSFSSNGESDKVVGISPVINDKIDRNASDSMHPDMEICNSSEQRRDRRR